MSNVMDAVISGIVKSAVSEILKKSGLKPSPTKRTRRKTRSTTASTSSRRTKRVAEKSGSGSGSVGRNARDDGARTVAKKQVSKRRTSAARSKTKRRS
ncbi:hypothetical protein M2360_002031 [Rhizobium sp. SG_E_25_P2]|jgi:hypothetical protein|nr:hypothetical protein [Rhizobium sp. SG_E_25_P2]